MHLRPLKWLLKSLNSIVFPFQLFFTAFSNFYSTLKYLKFILLFCESFEDKIHVVLKITSYHTFLYHNMEFLFWPFIIKIMNLKHFYIVQELSKVVKNNRNRKMIGLRDFTKVGSKECYTLSSFFWSHETSGLDFFLCVCVSLCLFCFCMFPCSKLHLVRTYLCYI